MNCACQKSIFDKRSNANRFVGIAFEKGRVPLRTNSALASRSVFCPTYTPPDKNELIRYSAVRGGTLQVFSTGRKLSLGDERFLNFLAAVQKKKLHPRQKYAMLDQTAFCRYETIMN